MEENKKSNKYLDLLFNTLGIVLIFVIWWIFSIIKIQEGYNPNLFPTPDVVISRFFSNFADINVYIALGWTFLRILIGFGISFLSAAIFGILAALANPVRQILKPLIAVMKSIPTAAITFLFILMLGRDWSPCALVFLVVFPIIYEAFYSGITNVDKNILNAARMESSIHSTKVIFNILIPEAVPYISLAVVTSLGLAMKVSVMAEIVAGGSSANGIGRLIYISNSIDVDMPNVYALSILTILILVILNFFVLLIKKKIKKSL